MRLKIRFTTHNGEVLELEPEDLPPSSKLYPAGTGFDGMSSDLGDPKPKDHGEFTTDDQTFHIMPNQTKPTAVPDIGASHHIVKELQTKITKTRRSKLNLSSSTDSPTAPSFMSMIYNEYGELVDAEENAKLVSTSALTVTQLLRIINKEHYQEFKAQILNVILPILDGGNTMVINDHLRMPVHGRLSCWEFQTSSKSSAFSTESPTDSNSDERQKIRVYSGPPRVLEIGCADGKWCFNFKNDHPDWIIDGVDSTDNWSFSMPEQKYRDFMEPHNLAHPDDYFGNCYLSQEQPDFTVRNINDLVSHSNPVPRNLYSLIRGRDIFDQVESYKAFLEDVRQILQPNGVVEFLEIDPRPRVNVVGRRRSENDRDDHTSRSETNWTDNILDRFRDPSDDQLALVVSGWVERVAERLQATLRPKDGVPAANLKSWLEGAGFWDVKQHVVRLPIGGHTAGGRVLLRLMIERVELENSVPQLELQLPKINFDTPDIKFGNYFINLHIVTGRKPRNPRPGDVLLDGTRQEIATPKFDFIGNLGDSITNPWKRREMGYRLSAALQHVATFQVLPDSPISSPVSDPDLDSGGAGSRAATF